MVPKNTGLFQKALAQLNWVDICFQKLILNFNSSFRNKFKLQRKG